MRKVKDELFIFYFLLLVPFRVEMYTRMYFTGANLHHPGRVMEHGLAPIARKDKTEDVVKQSGAFISLFKLRASGAN